MYNQAIKVGSFTKFFPINCQSCFPCIVRQNIQLYKIQLYWNDSVVFILNNMYGCNIELTTDRKFGFHSRDKSEHMQYCIDNRQKIGFSSYNR